MMPPDPILIKRAAEILSLGGVVAYPTETSYGLGASIDFPDALRRIFSIKHRPFDKPLLIIIPEASWLNELVSEIPRVAFPLMSRYWPGPLTMLFPAKPGLPFELTANTGKIGVRISGHPWAKSLVLATGRPITATSANISGMPPCFSAEDVRKQLKDPSPDFILNGGPSPKGPLSTIVDVSSSPPVIIRKGAITIANL